MASSFNRWEKDPFFSAAEEVQNSADRMESAFREWLQDRKQDAHFHELRRDLQTALGTAKWQLEAFEKAVGLVETSSEVNDTTARHKQFIVAIRGQICRVEESMKETGLKEGKRSLSWVQLDKGERDELALFLTGDGGSNRLCVSTRGLDDKPGSSKVDPTLLTAGVSQTNMNDGCGNLNCAPIGHLALQDVSGTSREDNKNNNGSKCQKVMDGHRRTASANAEFGDWKIAVADHESDVRRPLADAPPKVSSLPGFIRNIEAPSKLKLPKNGFKKLNDADCHQTENVFGIRSHPLSRAMHACYEKGNHCLNSCTIDSEISNDKKLYEWLGALQRQLQRSQYHIQYGRQFQVALWLITVVCLVVLFMVHAV